MLIAAPGPDMALVTRNALTYGRKAASLTGLGVCFGLLVWAFASALGVGILLERSAMAFTALKLAGAVYLGYLGVRSLVSGLQSDHHILAPSSSGQQKALRSREALKQGVLCNLLNPKAAVIWVSILPQFVRTGDSPVRLVLMLLAFEAMALFWLNLYSYLIVRAGESRFGLRVRQGMQRVTGVVLIGLGVRLAVERR